MRIPMLDLKRQQESIRAALNRVIADVINEAKYVSEEEVTLFEDRLSAFCGRAHAVGVASGTAALQIALMAAGIRRGDEVITVPNSFFATTEAICMAGARPCFVDVDPKTHLMSLPAVAESITERTRAVLPVHLYGNVVNIPALQALLDRRGRGDVLIIEDCAHAAGAALAARLVPLGRIGAFSFNPGKNIGGLGDGGAIVTDDEGVARRAKLLSNHGRAGKDEHAVFGFNARLDRLNDRVLALKMDYLEEWNARRRVHAAHYDDAFAGLSCVSPVWVEPAVRHAHHQYVIRCERRDELRGFLRARGVDTGIHYPRLIVGQEPLVALGFSPAQFPVAARLCERILSVPCFPELTASEVGRIAELVQEFAWREMSAGAPA